MRLVTPWAPPTYLKPCIVVSTEFRPDEGKGETALLFREALNANHALAYASDEVTKVEKALKRNVQSEFIIIKQHDSNQEAIDYHLDLTKDFHNGTDDAHWHLGMEPYMKLYDEYCPAVLKVYDN